ncbi:MAG: diiron oxygenase, partial [Candidatus Tectomicrobia bacterium]|nr:diiron oxygenase [Candidatus Tectomicrobia bacterium]
MHVGLKSRIDGSEQIADSPIDHNAMQAHSLLKKLTKNWPNRAQIKKDEFDEKALLDDSKDDFLTDLLPFKEHPLFLAASDEMKKKILTCGWLAYNEKTVDIEAKIITPACMRIIYGEVPGLQDTVSTHVASQTLVDEAYHVLLVNRAIQLTKERRGFLY